MEVRMTIKVGKKEIELTKEEYEELRLFFQNQERVTWVPYEPITYPWWNPSYPTVTYSAFASNGTNETNPNAKG